MTSKIDFLTLFNLRKISQSLVIFGVVLQLCLWVAPGTIALRQILLALTSIPSIYLLVGYSSEIVCRRLFLLPLFIFLFLLLWVVLHMIFFSYEQTLELKQFGSLWLRAILGVIIGFSLGFILRESICGRGLFFIAIFATSTINLSVYLYQSYIQGYWIAPSSFVSNYYFNKIEAAYFGAIAIAISAAQIFTIIKKVLTSRDLIKLIFWFVGIVIALLSSVVSSSKNGVAIGIYLCLLLMVGVIYLFIFSKFNRFKILPFLTALFFIIGIMANAHKSSASEGWGTLFQDVRIAVQIDKYTQWKNHSGAQLPFNETGKVVVINTYERFSWATVGLTLIAKYPMGYGLINNSFIKVLDLDGVNHNIQGQVHSGWIDFGLAYGIPGVLLLFSCLLALLILGFRAKDDYCFMSAWLALMLIPFCLIAEMSYKQYFESMLFFIALGCSWLASTGIKK